MQLSGGAENLGMSDGYVPHLRGDGDMARSIDVHGRGGDAISLKVFVDYGGLFQNLLCELYDLACW